MQHTQSNPIVLFPEDCWTIGEPYDNRRALDAYATVYDLSTKPVHRSQPVALDELTTLSIDYIQRLRRVNSWLFVTLMSLPPLRYFEPIHLRLSDTGEDVRFDIRSGLHSVSAEQSEPHATLSSESLAYIFRHDWGFDTLYINGRFLATQENYKRILKTFFLGPLNNTGRYLHPKTFLEPSFILRALSRLRKIDQ